jgi:hypothetical protein
MTIRVLRAGLCKHPFTSLSLSSVNGGEEYSSNVPTHSFKIMDDNLLHHFAEDIKCGNSDIELKGLNAEAEAAERNSRRSKKKREAEEKKEGGKRRKTGAGGESLV